MHQQGWTLPELLVSLVIAAILICLVAPKFQNLLKRQEAYRVSSELYQLCSYARAQATHIKLPLTLCGSKQGRLCDNSWAAGALLFIDKNRNKMIDAEDSVLQYRAFSLSPASLKWQGFSGNTLRIEAFGTPFASNGSFTYCAADKDPFYSRQVIINRSGRVRTSFDSDGDGIHEAADGSHIGCD